MHIGNYLNLVHGSEEALADAFVAIAKQHGDEPDVYEMCKMLSLWSDQHTYALKPFVAKYGEERSAEPAKLRMTLFGGPRAGTLALLRDLHDLWLMANEVNICWTVLAQAAQALRDQELESAIQQCRAQTERQVSWLLTRIKMSAPQTLIAKA